MALELPKFTKKEKQPGEKSAIMQKISQFFEKNPIMKIIIPVVLFLILVAVFLLVIFGDRRCCLCYIKDFFLSGSIQMLPLTLLAQL